MRMGLGLGLGAAAILWVADQLSLDRQRTQLEDLVALSADRTAGIIHRAAHDGMLRNDADGVRRIIENIAAQEGVDSVRIYNKEGRVRVSSRRDEEGSLVDKHSVRVHRVSRGAAAQGRARARRPHPHAALGRRRPRARHHQPHLQRGELHVVPRAPGVPARARDPRRAALDVPGRRRPARLRAADAVRPLRNGPRGSPAELPPALGARAAAGQAAAEGDRARGGGRSLRRRARAHLRRDGRARPLVEPDDGRPAARTGGPRGPQPHARGAGGGEDAPARADAPPDGDRREDGLAREAGRGRGPRDQQPARRHKDLRTAPPPPAQGVGGRPAPRRAGEGDRPHPRDGRRRGRPVRRHRPQPARVQPADGLSLRGGGRRAGGRALPDAPEAPGRDARGDARHGRRPRPPEDRVRRRPGPADDPRPRHERARGDAVRRPCLDRGAPGR